MGMRRVLLAIDGSDYALEAARSLAFFAPAEEYLESQPFKERVQITVFTCPPINRAEWPVEIVRVEPHVQDALAAAQAFVDGVASQLVGLGYEAHGLVTVGIPALLITQQAAEINADIILMGSHGRHGLTRFLMGSVAHAVLHRSRCPVLVVRLGPTSPHP